MKFRIFTTLVLLLTVTSLASAVNFNFSGDDVNKAGTTEENMFHPTLTNHEDETITFSLIPENDIPDEWFAFFCVGSSCYFDSADVDVPAGETITIDIHFTPNGFSGVGKTKMRVHAGNMEEEQSITFTYFAELDIIVVDDDGGEDYETYFIDPLENLEVVSYGVWDRSLEGFDEEDLNYCDQLYWLTGTTTENTLTEADQTRLMDFLDNMEGRLFLTGESIGSDIGDTDFYQDYLRVNLENSDTDEYEVTGIAGDPITDGMNFDIAGGSGADNQTKPEAISCNQWATPIFLYFSQEIAGSKSQNGIYKTVYTAFGFEAIADAATRNELILKIFYWLILPSSGIESQDISTVPATAALHQNYPNPFNPTTNINYEIAKTGVVELNIYNAGGELVKNLVNGSKAPGVYSVNWSGTDEAGEKVDSGVYFYTLSVTQEGGSETETRRMILLK
jgi:hypothetical protein